MGRHLPRSRFALSARRRSARLYLFIITSHLSFQACSAEIMSLRVVECLQVFSQTPRTRFTALGGDRLDPRALFW